MSDRMADALERNKFWWEMMKGAAIALAAAYSFMANQSSESARGEVEQARAALEARSLQTQFDIKAYELVEKALSSPPAVRLGRGLAAAAMVNALTMAPLRDGLQDALRAGVSDAELRKKLDAARQFDLDESEVRDVTQAPVRKLSWNLPWEQTVLAQSTAGTLRGFRVDLLYCESPTAATTTARKSRAEKGEAALQNSGAVVRLRLLPSLVQARPGYQSFTDEVRYTDGVAERSAALELARLLGFKRDALKNATAKTAGYLSAFYCA